MSIVSNEGDPLLLSAAISSWLSADILPTLVLSDCEPEPIGMGMLEDVAVIFLGPMSCTSRGGEEFGVEDEERDNETG